MKKEVVFIDVYDSLAFLHTVARGATVVESSTAADHTFGISGCEFNGLYPESVLAELL